MPWRVSVRAKHYLGASFDLDGKIGENRTIEKYRSMFVHRYS